jgi:hypothetical protein
VMSPYSYACLYSLYLYISDSGSLTVGENKKQVRDSIFFVNECKNMRGGRILNCEMERVDEGVVK